MAKGILTSLLFIFLSANQSVFAACAFQLSSSAIAVTANSISIDSPQTLSISRTNATQTATCKNYHYFFSKGSSSSYNRTALNIQNEALSYNLYKQVNQTNILKNYTDFNSSNDYITGVMNNVNQVYNSNFYFYLPALTTGSMVRGGQYNDNVILNVFSSGPSTGQYAYFEFSRTIPISIFVPKVVNLSLVDTGAPFDVNDTNQLLDFGNLQTNQELGFDLRVASNAGFKVSFSSQNNGKLKSTVGNYLIDYQLKVGSSTINLANSSGSPVQVASGSGVTSNQGSLYPIKVKILSVNQSLAGNYSDYITITAVTND